MWSFGTGIPTLWIRTRRNGAPQLSGQDGQDIMAKMYCYSWIVFSVRALFKSSASDNYPFELDLRQERFNSRLLATWMWSLPGRRHHLRRFQWTLLTGCTSNYGQPRISSLLSISFISGVHDWQLKRRCPFHLSAFQWFLFSSCGPGIPSSSHSAQHVFALGVPPRLDFCLRVVLSKILFHLCSWLWSERVANDARVDYEGIFIQLQVIWWNK